jgi:DNA repair protein RadC
MLIEQAVHFNIKSLSEDDRPREKLYLKGTQSVSDAELLAIIIGSGSRKETAVQLAQKILFNHDNSLDNLAKANIEDLMTFNGVGMAKAVSIMACLEMSRRRKNNTLIVEKPALKSSALLFNVIADQLLDKDKERFVVVYLNHKLQLIKTELLSLGTASETLVDIKTVAKEAIKCGARFLCLAHNHPAVNTLPSLQDKKMTKRMQAALNLFDINIIDHLIVGNQSYYSFADEHLI